METGHKGVCFISILSQHVWREGKSMLLRTGSVLETQGNPQCTLVLCSTIGPLAHIQESRGQRTWNLRTREDSLALQKKQQFISLCASVHRLALACVAEGSLLDSVRMPVPFGHTLMDTLRNTFPAPWASLSKELF